MTDGSASAESADPAILGALARLDLVAPGAQAKLTPLSGGVSSDIWRVDASDRTFCIKRALAKLKVVQDWRAPVERSHYEYLWLEEAGRHVPDAVPRLHGYDEASRLFALEWLEPSDYHWWKGELRDGRVKSADADAVGRALARIHAGTAGRSEIASRFPTDKIFYAIRLEPYLVAAARVHADLAPRLEALVRTTATTRRALVHGDVSPKNIMIGPRGPVLLDAECAWYGDPAFDIAFCLNHLLLKCLWTPAATPGFLAAFDALACAYLAGVTWEPRAELETRAACLLPGLFLARVDGKSPVEYITREAEKDLVRSMARTLLISPPAQLTQISSRWGEVLRSRS
jgi:aminoglycoside phosphotransferase (APT) family kinase protein